MRVVAALACALLAGWLAEKKHRHVLMWSLFGALANVVALLVLFFLPALCPHCRQPLTNRQAIDGMCPTCGGERQRGE